MHYFTPAKTLPEGIIYLTDLTHVADFSDWLAEFETLLNQNRRFATVCTPMLLIEPDAAQLAFFREQSSKLAPALGVNYIVEADEQTALLRAEEALKVV
ncbi:hypothetical protein [Neisseria elongata]|uniref:hypothetical protein n=1 Tax=Neisseria elongata TaxID=495 RepID=UPI000666184D|nr:hypothetical protein [Neisseria elongata]